MTVGRTTYIVVFIALLLSLVIASCSKENPAYNRENIKAAWIVNDIDGSPLVERDCYFMVFDESGIVTYHGVSTTDSGYVWDNNRLYYEVYCCDLTINGQLSGLFGYTTPITIDAAYDFISSEDSSMTLGIKSYSVNNVVTEPEYSSLGLEKLPSTYASADSISGIWQFNARNGQEYSDYRIHFQDDGGFVFYTRTGENEWTAGGDSDTYSLYDYFIALTLYDNAVFGTPSRWDVKCFIIDSVSKTTNRLALSSGEDSYVLSFISAN